MATSGSPNGMAAKWDSLNSRQKKTLIVSGGFFIIWFVLLFNPWASPPPGFSETVEDFDSSRSAPIAGALTKSVGTHGGPKTAAGAVIAAAALPLLWRLDFWIWLVATVGSVLYHYEWSQQRVTARGTTAPNPDTGLAVIIWNVEAAQQKRDDSEWLASIEVPIEDLRRGKDLAWRGGHYRLDSGATTRYRSGLSKEPYLDARGAFTAAMSRGHAGRRPEHVFVYVPKTG